MIDPTHNEKAAVLAVLPILGDYVAGIGMDKPVLGELLIFYTYPYFFRGYYAKNISFVANNPLEL